MLPTASSDKHRSSSLQLLIKLFANHSTREPLHCAGDTPEQLVRSVWRTLDPTLCSVTLCTIYVLQTTYSPYLGTGPSQLFPFSIQKTAPSKAPSRATATAVLPAPALATTFRNTRGQHPCLSKPGDGPSTAVAQNPAQCPGTWKASVSTYLESCWVIRVRPL